MASISLGACGSDDPKPKRDMETAGQSGASATAGSAGSLDLGASAGSVGITPSTAAGASGASAGAGGSAGTGTAGSAGSAGSMASAGTGAEAGSMGDAGMPMEEDPFAALFGPAELSCDGLLCLDTADCATLYPDENTKCKFTSCVDFVCQ